MGYLEYKDFVIGRYDINITLEDSTTYFVLTRKKDLNYKDKFLIQTMGINKYTGSCIYNDKEIFDNEEYFNNRFYFDFSKKYLSTLNIDYIKESLEYKYNIFIDKDKFKEVINLTNLRSEVLIKEDYSFSPYGINACGIVLLRSMTAKNVIINNPFIYLLRDKTDNKLLKKDNRKKTISEHNIINTRELIKKEIQNKEKYNNIIIGSDNVYDFIDCIDKYIVFTDFNNVLVIDKKNDSFVVIEELVGLRKKLFRTTYNKYVKNDYTNMVICVNDFSKEEFRTFSKNRIKYKIITFEDMLKGINDDE